MKKAPILEENNVAASDQLQVNSEKVRELKGRGYSEADGHEIIRIGSALGLNFDEHPSAYHHLSLLEDLDRSTPCSSQPRWAGGKPKFLNRSSLLKFHRKCTFKIYKRKLEPSNRSVGDNQVSQ